MLAKIPFWGWLLIIMTALYLVYNPLGYSLWHMWLTSPDPMHLLPFRILATLVVGAVLGLVVHGAANSTSVLGLMVMLSLIGAVLWSSHVLIAFDVLSFAFWCWALQPMMALVLTTGWQWPKIWRRSTGAVSVNDADTPV